MSSQHTHTILYAEDDADDVFMVRQAFEQLDNQIHLEHAINGLYAMQQLEAMHREGHLPCLIILDINMPGMDGREALKQIKESDHFHKIPVVLFTTSSSEHDRAFAQKWGAHFITKPLIFDELRELAKIFVSHCGDGVRQ